MTWMFGGKGMFLKKIDFTTTGWPRSSLVSVLKMSIFSTYISIVLKIQLECMANANSQNAAKIYKVLDT